MDTPVTGTPRLLLRLEGLAVLAAALVGYRALDASWTLFAVLFLIPDLSLVGYLGGPRAGAWTYNALHTYVGPCTVGTVAFASEQPELWPICLIWVAHIGMDRAAGFGLKFATAFSRTHLGPVSRQAPTGLRANRPLAGSELGQ